jgi:hypothetical protein
MRRSRYLLKIISQREYLPPRPPTGKPGTMQLKGFAIPVLPHMKLKLNFIIFLQNDPSFRINY